MAQSPVGDLVTITGMDARRGVEYEHKAFLPHPLPDALDLEPATYGALIEATSAVARLDEAAFRLPNPQLLARPAIRHEADRIEAVKRLPQANEFPGAAIDVWVIDPAWNLGCRPSSRPELR